MRVFISWSGNLSKQVAQLLGSWLEDVLQGTKSWISTDDIDKGSIWFSDITSQLAETSVGILCLTRENLNSPWIMFEAGSLSKGLSKARVCPLLVNLAHTDLIPPLSQFNGTLPTKEDLLKLLKTINTLNSDKVLPDERFQKTFERWWPEFETQFQEILKKYKPTSHPAQRPVPEMVAEILEVTRSIQRSMQWESISNKLNTLMHSQRRPRSLLDLLSTPSDEIVPSSTKRIVDLLLSEDLKKTSPEKDEPKESGSEEIKPKSES